MTKLPKKGSSSLTPRALRGLVLLANAIVGIILFFFTATLSQAESFPNVEVDLVTDYLQWSQNGEYRVGVLFRPHPGWHVYWKYPGDSGLPPKVKWQAPKSVKIGQLNFPIPERIPVGPLVNYGYKDDVLIYSNVTFGKTYSPGDVIPITADLSWLICREECIPGKGKLSSQIRFSEVSVQSPWWDRFEAAKENLPQKVQLESDLEVIENQLQLVVNQLNFPEVPQRIYFIPDSNGQIENAAAQQVEYDKSKLKLILQKAKFNFNATALSGIIMFQFAGGRGRGLEIKVPIPGQPAPAPIRVTNTGVPFFSALILAFLGGLILNLMPCVFPVLSIKILSLINQAGKKDQHPFLHAAAFSFGAIVSFWILAGILIGLRSTGQSFGWGFQLQNPIFVIVLTFLLFAIGLNLAGVFHFGSRLQNLAGRAQPNEGNFAAFFSGVLATLVATPCTAPFMGSAIAASLSAPAWFSFCVFTALGLGMSLPYLILATYPNLLSFLPKPGVWMEKLQQFLSFPMFATCIWLLSVLGQQQGLRAVSYLLFGLLLMAMSLWAWGQLKRNFSNTVLILLCCLGSLYVALPGIDSAKNLDWEKFDKIRLNQLIQEGNPVFIDFTAQWCLTCKVNKLVVFSSDKVIEKFREKKVKLLLADWTSFDPEISDAIKSYGASGVPLNILYPGKVGEMPYIFPTILTPAIVLSELDKL